MMPPGEAPTKFHANWGAATRRQMHIYSGVGFRVWGSGFRFQGLGFRVWDGYDLVYRGKYTVYYSIVNYGILQYVIVFIMYCSMFRDILAYYSIL